MKGSPQHLETQPFPLEREWTTDGIPVLRLTGALPQPVGPPDRRKHRIRSFYRHQAEYTRRYCQHFLLPEAESAHRAALETSAPLPIFTVHLSYEITCNQDGIWSLHTDLWESCGAERSLLRRGDTWDLGSGLPLPLSACFPRHWPIRRQLLSTAADTIRQTPAPWREDWQLILRRSFRRENFYLTPEGLAFYWQMYALAPASEGCPTFLLPYGQGGCRFPGPK